MKVSGVKRSWFQVLAGSGVRCEEVTVFRCGKVREVTVSVARRWSLVVTLSGAMKSWFQEREGQGLRC